MLILLVNCAQEYNNNNNNNNNNNSHENENGNGAVIMNKVIG